MRSTWNLLTLVGYLSLVAAQPMVPCRRGFSFDYGECSDIDECEIDNDDPEPGPCGENKICLNTIGSFTCQCVDGYRTKTGALTFSAESPEGCVDVNECKEHDTCGANATCFNTNGSYYCTCNSGFALKSGASSFTGTDERCEDICSINKTICGNRTCHPTPNGHLCACHKGFTNYFDQGAKCITLDCDVFVDHGKEEFPAGHEFASLLKKSCQNLSETGISSNVDGYDILERLLLIVDKLLSSGIVGNNRKVSAFLAMMESALGLVSPLITPPGTDRFSNLTELNVLVHRGHFPDGPVTFSSSKAKLGINMETAAGSPSSYPGFATVSMLSYSNLEKLADGYFSAMEPQEGHTFKINSRVVTVSVSNRNTSHLDQPVNLTFDHLEQSAGLNHTCVFWDSSKDGGSWSPRGCTMKDSSPKRTLCSCNHLSSFAVLMSLYEMEDKFDLQLMTWVGLSLSLVCLFLCILTFSMIRSIKGPRTTIHLHLSISLFVALLIFLTCISRTENKVGCAVIASLLHFSFLAAFCWMCLEGVQLFRMVVLVFNTNFKTLYMMIGGYGVPAVIVAVSLSVKPEEYGTDRYCWLSPKLILSFYGPVCVMLVINIFFFLITVWKLAQKFASLNPDLDKLQKIKTFTITAVAQLCVLGITWIFGCFQFDDRTLIMTYLFTISGCLQGVMMFVFHCLFSKQVREEYGNIFSKLCTPSKKKYSEFGSLSSKPQASKSTQDTGESHI
ncbi:adhesion G protein-coupled receptor E5 [Nelusetta ayraudi]|uniref:adhesion G protein-coupled receptor E5 n=1 Tax=Nelusetta ayraudi TaxID=303726 RepID=UPI003F70AF30